MLSACHQRGAGRLQPVRSVSAPDAKKCPGPRGHSVTLLPGSGGEGMGEWGRGEYMQMKQ